MSEVVESFSQQYLSEHIRDVLSSDYHRAIRLQLTIYVLLLSQSLNSITVIDESLKVSTSPRPNSGKVIFQCLFAYHAQD